MLPSSTRSSLTLLARAAFLVSLTLLAVRGAFRPAVDLAVFWTAGGHFRAGVDLYTASSADVAYRYAPGIAALFAPLSALPFNTARALWSAVCAAMVLGIGLWLDRRIGPDAPFAVPLAWGLLAQALAQELGYGQVDLLVVALAVAGFALDDRGAEKPAGALLALTVALKVAPIVLFLDFAWRRRWRPFVGAAAAGVGLLAITAARYGIGGCFRQHVAWLTSQSGEVAYMIDSVRNQSLWSILRLVGLGRPYAAASCVALLAAALSAPRHRRLLLLAAMPLVSAYGWPEKFVSAAPLLAVTLAHGGAPAWIAATAAGAISALGYDVAGPRVEEWAEGHRVLGALMLLLVLAGRAAAGAPPRIRTAAQPRA